MDRALARIERKLAEELQIATLPSSYTLAHSSVLRVGMLRALGETQWHHIASIVKGFLWDIAEESLVEGLQWRILIREHIPGGGLALEDSQIVVAVDQRARKSREENADLEVGHIGIALDDTPLVAVAIEEQHPVLLAQGNTSLVEQAIVQPYVLSVRLLRSM